MGAYKNGDAMYDVISTRVSEMEFKNVQGFADVRHISRGAAARMLMAIGLEFMSRGDANAKRSMSGLQE